MAKLTKRPHTAGRNMAKAIIEMVHLMYQNKTAISFYEGLYEEITKEIKRRQNQS